jgi:hypothetical protein
VFINGLCFHHGSSVPGGCLFVLDSFRLVPYFIILSIQLLALKNHYGVRMNFTDRIRPTDKGITTYLDELENLDYQIPTF